jgi:ABC-type nickel/cobalt efflux system permease component RcnA
MTDTKLFTAILAILVIAGVLNFIDYKNNQIKAEAMTVISWFLIILAGIGCIFGIVQK